MLIITLLKAVPGKTTKVATISSSAGGAVLNRNLMDLVLNPHDEKAVDAADYVKRSTGGKIVALSMGPDMKLGPIMQKMYDMAVEGVDENVIVSDRRMAGADTLATAYAVALGIKKLLKVNSEAIEEIISMVNDGINREYIKSRSNELYLQNLLPNRIYSTIPSSKQSIIWGYYSGRIIKEEVLKQLTEIRESMNKFIILAGVKTTDGETGSVGPQVAEALGESLNITIPQITYVEDFHIDSDSQKVLIKRNISRTIQNIESELPVILTISPEYKSRVISPSVKKQVRMNSYHGKLDKPIVWNGDVIEADPSRLGLAGSPTIVGPGIDVGKPPVQKYPNKTLVFKKNLDVIEFNGEKIGPYQIGDVADNLPKELINKFRNEGSIEIFNYEDLMGELFVV